MANCQFAFIAESDFDGYLWTPLISITRHAAAQIFVHFLPAGVEKGGGVVPGVPIFLCQWKQVGFKQKHNHGLGQLTLDGFLGPQGKPRRTWQCPLYLCSSGSNLQVEVELREPLKGAESVLKTLNKP